MGWWHLCYPCCPHGGEFNCTKLQAHSRCNFTTKKLSHQFNQDMRGPVLNSTALPPSVVCIQHFTFAYVGKNNALSWEMCRGFEAPWGPRSKMAMLPVLLYKQPFPRPKGKVGRPPNQATSQDWIFRAQEQKSHLQHHLKSAKAICEMTAGSNARLPKLPPRTKTCKNPSR